MEDNIRFPLPEIVRHRAASEGQAGQQWLESLDDVLSSIERDWELEIGPALPGGNAAFVAEATDKTGKTFVIKLPTPGSEAGRQEAAILGAAGGKGYALLVRHDAAHRAMLLERLGPRLDQLDMPGIDQLDIMCITLLKAWMRAPADAPYVTGRDKANSLAIAMVRLHHELGQPCSQTVLDTALMYCRDRAAAWRPENAVLAHGNPHPGNILAVPASDPLQFKFIDPDGLAIEPAYDLGVLLRGWNENIEDPHAHDIARSHARHLTTRTQVPSEAIWQWGYIERVSTGLHLIQSGEVDQGRRYLRTAEAIQNSMPR